MSNFVWYDLMTSDPKAAESFYRNVIGWDAKDSGVMGAEYTIFSSGSAMVAGLMAIPEDARAAGARPAWRGYVWTEDVDACARRVKSAGGTVCHGPEDIPGVGRFAVVADPHGAVFLLFKPNGAGGPQAPAGAIGHVGWHELHAGDRESDFAFYAGLFGWKKTEAMDMGPMGTYQLFATETVAVGGVMTKSPEIPAPFWLYYFNVDAIDAAVERVVKNQGKIIHGPQEVPGGSWIVQCIDPQGAVFAMVAAKR